MTNRSEITGVIRCCEIQFICRQSTRRRSGRETKMIRNVALSSRVFSIDGKESLKRNAIYLSDKKDLCERN